MRQRWTVEESAPARTDRPLRRLLCSYASRMRWRLPLPSPHAGMAPLISIAVPVIAVALTRAPCTSSLEYLRSVCADGALAAPRVRL